jgi:hypothetical protein
MLAVLEHIPEDRLAAFAEACAGHLRPGGLLLITVPSPLVDRLLHVLMGLRLLDAETHAEHHGFDPRRTPAVFAGCGLALVARRPFELGLNTMFAFRKPGGLGKECA